MTGATSLSLTSKTWTLEVIFTTTCYGIVLNKSFNSWVMKSSTDLYRLIVAMLSLPDMVLRSMGRKVVEAREGDGNPVDEY